MAVKKQKSKRLTTRKRERMNKLGRLKQKRVRREAVKKEKNAVVPKSVYLTEEQRRHLEDIKKNTLERNKNLIEETNDIAPYIQELTDCLDYDAFVAVVDYRDIESSRNKKSEEFLSSNGKKIYYFINHFNSELNLPYEYLNTENSEVITNLSILSGASSLCLFGYPRCGKFVVSKQITDAFPGVKITTVRVPTRKNGPSDIFRGAADYSKVDLITVFGAISEFIDKTAIRDFYMLEDYHNAEELMTLLGKKYSNEERKRRIMDAGATRFVKDVLQGKILWYSAENNYNFKFLI
ncbi:hypothetical protein ENBRE01_1082 [Enteropsectra breve]|nr:hypothetical protein ENBRE01_1082 [Enteropsectra breve]